MKFSITQESNLDQSKVTQIHSIGIEIDNYIKNENFGSSIEKIIIGVVCVKPEFEQFFKVRKPKYVKEKTETHSGTSVSISKVFTFDVKLDYNSYLALDGDDLRNSLLKKIIESLSNLNNLPKQIVDFNKVDFIEKLKGLSGIN
ncbi:hypothetical protein [Ekhidna sp.]